MPTDAIGIVFRHPGGRIIIGAAAALLIGTGLIWAGRGLGPTLASYLGGLTLPRLLVFHKLVFARVRASNWLLRLSHHGVFIQFRSYLNQHLSPADPTVVFVPYGAIRLVRRRTESK